MSVQFRPQPSRPLVHPRGGEPIRIVIRNDGGKYIKQGNHRLYAARQDGLRSVKALIYGPEQWEASFESSFEAWGSNDPGIGPREVFGWDGTNYASASFPAAGR